MRVHGGVVLCGVLCSSLAACEHYHHVERIGKRSYFTLPHHDNPAGPATYVTDVPDAQCSARPDLFEVCVNPATAAANACAGVPCGTAGAEHRHVEISARGGAIRVHVDGGTCPLPLDQLDAHITSAAQTCRTEAQLGVAALVRKQLPRTFEEALRDEAGFGTVDGKPGLYIEVLPGMRLRLERSSYLPAITEVSKLTMNATGDTSYIRVSRATATSTAPIGPLVFDAALARMDVAVDPGDVSAYATTGLDLDGTTPKLPYWYVLYPEAQFAPAGPASSRKAETLNVMVGADRDHRALLEQLAASPNRSSCVNVLCDHLDDDPARPCGIADIGNLRCMRFPGRTVIVPEIHLFLKSSLTYVPAGSRLGDLLTGYVGDRASALSHSVIHLDRWYRGRYVRVVLPTDWSEVPVLAGDRVSW